MAALAEPDDEMGADKTGRAGDRDLHPAILPCAGCSDVLGVQRIV
jgi:hypothetical protein